MEARKSSVLRIESSDHVLKQNKIVHWFFVQHSKSVAEEKKENSRNKFLQRFDHKEYGEEGQK